MKTPAQTNRAETSPAETTPATAPAALARQSLAVLEQMYGYFSFAPFPREGDLRAKA